MESPRPVFISGQKRGVFGVIKRELGRRSAIELAIGHMVRQIAQLYAIEATVRGLSPDIRLAARKEHSLPIVAALKPWFKKQLSMISSGSTLAEDPLRTQSLAGSDALPR